MEDALHQLVHGYEHGHQLLAGSVKLSADEMDLITRLSDLSGSMIPDESLVPYLSFYPLPSRSYYAVAKTWPDRDAARAGCVLTHTLLIPHDKWAISTELGGISALHRLPQRSNLSDYETTLQTSVSPRLEPTEAVGSDDFITKFFGEGIRPLVWFAVKHTDQVAWRVVSALWPSLRGEFSCCSVTLQPRMLDDRPFDLMFAPASARARFSEFAGPHIVGGASAASVEQWARQWKDMVFAGDGERGKEVFELSSGLEPSPNAIRKVFLFVDLQERASSAPLAALGALDVLESIGSTSGRGRTLVEQLVRRALGGVRNAPAPWALEVLCLVGLRLDRVDRSIVDQGVDELIAQSVREYVESGPVDGIALAERFSTRDLGKLPSSFVRGLSEAIAIKPHRESLEALALAHHVGRNLVEISPHYTRLILLAARSLEMAFSDVLVDWYRGVRGQERRAALRRELTPILEHDDDAALLEELLKDVQQHEVVELCGDASQQTVTRKLGKLFSELVGERYPSDVLSWSRGRRIAPCTAIAFIVAGAIPLTADGLSDAYTFEESGYLIAAFVDRALQRSPSEWLTRACKTPDLWSHLLTEIDNEFVSSVISRFVGVIDRSALARAPGSLELLSRAPFNVQSYAVRQLLLDQLSGADQREHLDRWLSTPWAANVIANDASFLRSVISEDISPGSDGFIDAWVNAWRMLEVVSRRIRTAAASIIEVCGLLLWRRPEPWPTKDVANAWRQVLANLAHDSARYEVGCTQAIKFAFDNTRLPLAPVVAEAFFAVHAAALRNQSRPSWDFLGMTNWDKGGELRRRIVDAFYYGDWEPHWFILAAREPWLLRKLCKRMLKQWRGIGFLERAMLQLSNQAPHDLASELADILRHPEYREEWD